MLAQQEHLGRASRAALFSDEARRHDARLVRHEHVTRTQVVGDVAEHAVLERAGCAIHDEQAAAVAVGRGLLRDELGGQIVVEVAREHIGSFVQRRGSFESDYYRHSRRGGLGAGWGRL